jgi:hypothetical protein
MEEREVPQRNSLRSRRVCGARFGARGEAIRVSGMGIALGWVKGGRAALTAGAVVSEEKSQTTCLGGGIDPLTGLDWYIFLVARK